MPEAPQQPGSRSVSVGRDLKNAVVVTGDDNTWTHHAAQLPPPETVDIATELRELRHLLAQLNAPDQGKIENALADADDELQKPEPDKDEVGQALERALGYAKKAEGFAGVIDKLKPHVTAAASWLGQHWHKIVSVVGITI